MTPEEYHYMDPDSWPFGMWLDYLDYMTNLNIILNENSIDIIDD
jgi:hypothetical protein